MNTQELSFGQRVDSENGLVECWFTHGALDWIKQQDWTDKNIIMFGGGMGNEWLAARCKNLIVIERDGRWLTNSGNYSTKYRPCNDSSGMDEMYCAIPDGFIPDIVINDDAYRYEVIVKALTLPRPLILIVDNWMQDFVFYCPKGEELLKNFKQEIYPCTTHTDHEGNCWKTAIFHL